MNILNKLTIKHLKMNKKRTIVTIIGIILSTALMVGLGTLFSSFRDLMIKETINYNGAQHVIMRDIKVENLKYVENNINVLKEKLLTERELGSALIGSKNENKPYLEIIDVNNNYLNGVTLIEGVIPKNGNEIIIPNSLLDNLDKPFKVGDTLSLEIGTRLLAGEKLDYNNSYDTEEILQVEAKKEYKIVGIYKRLATDPYHSAGFKALTINSKTDVSIMNAFIQYKNIKDTEKTTESIVKTMNDNKLSYSYNDSLLSFYGASSYDNINTFLINTMLVILSLLVIACTIVIYNSFSISVMERKKQFGLFSSIGATSKQLRKTVFYEASIVGIIGIVLGIIAGILGVFVTLLVINNLIKDMLFSTFDLVLYPAFIIIPIVYMIITIIISAYLPAKRASKISPIEAIRLNDDIKVNKKKVKSNKVVKKLFGIEGDVAYKNMKRNKKKYRITIISLFISIVLFISFSTFLEIGKQATKSVMGIINYDIIVGYDDYTIEEVKDIHNRISKVKGINNSYLVIGTNADLTFSGKNLSADGKKAFYYSPQNDEYTQQNTIQLLAISDDEYSKYISAQGISNNKIIIINDYEYLDKDRKNYQIKIFDKSDNIKITPLVKEGGKDIASYNYEVALSKTSPSFIKDYQLNFMNMVGIISESMLKEISKTNLEVNKASYEHYTTFIKAKDHKAVEQDIKTLLDYKEDQPNKLVIQNFSTMMQAQKNMELVISILLYGFITLVTLIGVTSVFNTINTSMALRRKEFAVLRSIGLSNKQFNKMIRFESLLFGFKSLLYGLPVSFFFILLFNMNFSNISFSTGLVIPYTAIIISIVGVFILTFITMNYAVKKQKKENILDVIREENI